MLGRFHAAHAPLRDLSVTGGSAWLDKRLTGIEGYSNLVAEFAGATFGSGLYRIHDELTGPRADTLISEAFPEFASRVCPFGYDWLGRQFAIDYGRVVDGQPQVVLFEPGTGEALEIPLPLSTFHDEELIEYADAALATDFFESWCASNIERYSKPVIAAW